MKFKRQVIKIYFLQIKLPNWQLSLTEYSSASNNIMHSKNWFWHLVQMFHPLPFGFKCPMSMFGGELHCKKTHSPVGCFVPSKRYSTHVGDNQKVRFELMTALDKARRALSEIQWIWVIFRQTRSKDFSQSWSWEKYQWICCPSDRFQWIFISWRLFGEFSSWVVEKFSSQKWKLSNLITIFTIFTIIVTITTMLVCFMSKLQWQQMTKQTLER